MISSSLGRSLGALAGIVFLALILISGGILPSTPGPDDAAARIVKAYADADGAMLGVYLNSVAALALLWFGATLRAHLAAAEGGVARVSSIVLAAAAAGSVFGVAHGIIHGAVWTRIDQADSVNADAVALLYVVAGSLLSGFFILGGAMALATCVVGVRHGGLPGWAAWLSGILGVLMVVGAFDVTLSQGIGILGLLGMALYFLIIPLVLFMRVQVAGEPTPAR